MVTNANSAIPQAHAVTVTQEQSIQDQATAALSVNSTVQAHNTVHLALQDANLVLTTRLVINATALLTI